MKALRLALVASSLLALAASPFAAEKPAQPPAFWKSSSEPLQIDSKTLETFSGGELVVFQGDVVAKQGAVTLHSDRLEVTIDKQTRTARLVKAHGSVRIRKDEIVATGTDATYDAQTGVTVLTGSPKVWRDRDVVAGDKITLYLAEDRTVVEGAKAVIYQQGQQGQPGQGQQAQPGSPPKPAPAKRPEKREP
ncbi:MAG: lipopolysaccharide transport periplasmic protein LptA [Deltaproteobacteria bacterium]|nr:lipopolysaccharide transport periplasmic protein LptA [Deltaproteobacteria bacterium]